MPVRRSHISQVDTLAVFGKPVPMAGSGKERKLEVATFSMGFLSDFAVFLFLNCTRHLPDQTSQVGLCFFVGAGADCTASLVWPFVLMAKHVLQSIDQLNPSDSFLLCKDDSGHHNACLLKPLAFIERLLDTQAEGEGPKEIKEPFFPWPKRDERNFLSSSMILFICFR